MNETPSPNESLDRIEDLAAEVALLENRARSADSRYLLGLTGCCGSGKSTVAERLSEALSSRHGVRSRVVGMDGFHFSNTRLDEMDLRPIKGAPQTFDVDAFIDVLRSLKDAPPRDVSAPAYCRERHEPRADAVRVLSSDMLVIVEGNYLLLERPPWDEARRYLDMVWFLDVPPEICLPRVRARHIRGGCAPESADERITRNDSVNAALIWSTKGRADRLIRLRDDPM